MQPLIENPELYPAWGYQIDSERNPEVARLRGKDAFDAMEQIGLRVEEISGRGGSFEIRKPWTYIFMFVNTDVDSTEELLATEGAPCSIIMDCHFPIMRLEHAFTKDPDDMFKLIENRDIILGNLALADAVTVPNSDWAADLAEVNPNVYYLPDLHIESGDDDEPTGREIEDLNRFIVRLNEVANASAAAKKARPCRCLECVEKRANEKTVHRYLSTACLHATEPGREDLHQYCQTDAKRYDGVDKIAATCKWCEAPCICDCHKKEE
jgi:hypothetical protein